jgi:hypothetical protein
MDSIYGGNYYLSSDKDNFYLLKQQFATRLIGLKTEVLTMQNSFFRILAKSNIITELSIPLPYEKFIRSFITRRFIGL